MPRAKAQIFHHSFELTPPKQTGITKSHSFTNSQCIMNSLVSTETTKRRSIVGNPIKFYVLLSGMLNVEFFCDFSINFYANARSTGLQVTGHSKKKKNNWFSALKRRNCLPGRNAKISNGSDDGHFQWMQLFRFGWKSSSVHPSSHFHFPLHWSRLSLINIQKST